MTSELLSRSISCRQAFIEASPEPVEGEHDTAYRLFNGFYEGEPSIVIDIYGHTAIINNYADIPEQAFDHIQMARECILAQLPFIRVIIVKERNALDLNRKNGHIIFGPPAQFRADSKPNQWIREGKIRYAVDLLRHQDTTFYIDTRGVRQWAFENLQGKSVLNTFAYTGSLGVAASAGGAQRVVHVDLNRSFLNICKRSYDLNHLPLAKPDFVCADFFTVAAHMRRRDIRFDCVFLDPPFFARTAKGTVDVQHQFERLVNKVRPLINDNGYLLVINNALYVSGSAFIAQLERLGADGYLAIDRFIDVPVDVTGYPPSRVSQPPLDPAPFNHPTKIALLRIQRRQDSG